MKLIRFSMSMGLAFWVVGCGGEEDRLRRCRQSQTAVDVSETSALEDAQSYLGMHDALAFTLDATEVGTTRRIQSVDVLALIPSHLFDAVPDGVALDVELYDGDTPKQPAAVVRQFLEKSALEWSDVVIEAGAQSREKAHKQAWWKFEMPDTGPIGEHYFVAVVWPEEVSVLSEYYQGDDAAKPHPAGLPIGYSNYNRPCAQNWTRFPGGFFEDSETPTGVWVQNDPEDTVCSWPMLRVQIETELKLSSGCL